MNGSVITHVFSDIPIPYKEVLRYSGIRGECSQNIKNDILLCLKESKSFLSPKACFLRTELKTYGDISDFGIFKVKSEKLSKNLKRCNEALLFTATVGAGIDMLINRYSSIRPVKALYFQAIGAAAVESVCDTLTKEVFLKELKNGEFLRPRFSPGYGDFSVSYQKELFAVLDCQRKIGVSLTDGGLMAPSKSVTAIVGIGPKREDCKNGCEACENASECPYAKKE